MNKCFLKVVYLAVPFLWLDLNLDHKKEDNMNLKLSPLKIIDRFISIDNDCAWPNFTKLEDGIIHASILNQPSHARREGSVEEWPTTDGELFWKKSGVAAPLAL